jgi:ribosomal protein S18 acetylase RimI-like enzyme
VTSLVPLDPDAMASWLAAETAGYVDELVTSGEDRRAAERQADGQLSRLFPGGRPAPGQYVFTVVEDGRRVGTLWIGSALDGPPEHWWVWSIAIDAGARGRGIGRAAMQLGEAEARRHGATQIGLNVFGRNTVARRLYQRLGYEEAAVRMRKVLE